MTKVPMTEALTKDSADALLFDLGRVVIDFDLRRTLEAWAVDTGSDPQMMMAALAGNASFHRYETGHLTDAEFFAAVRSELGLDLSHDDLLAGWNEIFIGEMPGIAPLLARAGQPLPLYALSNTNAAHVAHFEDHFADLLTHFRRLFLSSRIGMRKPDAKIYDFVAAEIGIAPERIVFFDDLAENVEAARARGMAAVHVRSSDDVARTLDELGL
jgi:glucose-1-phosphatase